MKKFSFYSIFVLVTLTMLMTSCSKKLGCYYSVEYPIQLKQKEISHTECALETFLQEIKYTHTTN